jgi:putative RNA 2'-phosphotransferase
MDAAGWVAVDDVLRYLKIPRRTLDELIAGNDKRRVQLVDDRVRACQGHSSECGAITREALEASWSVVTSDASIWHGTRPELVVDIAREGIRALSRTHVHLAPGVDSVVGKRAAVGVLLEVSPACVREAGFTVFCAQNGVILTRHVPARAIVGLRALSRRARAQESRLRALLELRGEG